MTENETSRPTSLLEAIDECRSRMPDAGLSFDGRFYSVAELDDRARRQATLLSTLAAPEERVALILRNSVAAITLWWATTYCSAVVVPVNVENTGEVLAHQLQLSDPAVILCGAEFVETAKAAVRSIPADIPIIVVDTEDDPLVGLDKAITAPNPTWARPVLGPRSTSHLVFTAGTTGPSKGCVVDHGYLMNFARQIIDGSGRRQRDVLWTALPLFHMNAIQNVVGTLLIGGRMAIAERFSVSRFWQDVASARATIVPLIGSLLTMIANHPAEPDDDYRGTLRLVTGSPVTEDIATQWQARFGVTRVGSSLFGMTEASLITSTTPDTFRVGTAGRRNDSFDVAILDEDGRILPDGQAGEIACRPRKPGVMFSGYWRQPEATLGQMQDLWFHTGDIGRFDADGYLHFIDRGKDYLRRRGENISSFEIESVLINHPAISEVAVHAVFSETGEDDVKYTIVLSSGSAVAENDIQEWAKGRVPRYALPRYIEFRSSLPRNPVGRVQKHRLRDAGVTPTTVEFERDA